MAVSKTKTVAVADGKEHYTAVQEFRHEDDFSKKYLVDSDVSHLTKEKLEHLEKIGVVKKAE